MVPEPNMKCFSKVSHACIHASFNPLIIIKYVNSHNHSSIVEDVTVREVWTTIVEDVLRAIAYSLRLDL